MAEALYATVRELRMAGVKAKDLEADAFESKAKHAELKALLGAYEKFLKDNNRGDMAAVYEEAMQHPDWCPIQPEDCWTELPGTIWTPLERRLIDAMPGERILPRALQIPNATHAAPSGRSEGGVGSPRCRDSAPGVSIRSGSSVRRMHRRLE